MRFPSFKSLRLRVYLLLFFSGLLLALLFCLKTEGTYEKNLFRSIANSTRQRVGISNDSTHLLMDALHSVHQIINPERHFSKGYVGTSLTQSFQPLSTHLMGSPISDKSYLVVFARLMDELGFKFRLVQLRKNGMPATYHDVIEVRVDSSWIAVDPALNLYFLKEDGRLASVADVQKYWSFFRQKISPQYLAWYSYKEVTYNHGGVSTLTSVVESGLAKIVGISKANELSFFYLVLKKMDLLLILVSSAFLITILLLIFYSIKTVRFKKIKMNEQMPVEDIMDYTQGKTSTVTRIKITDKQKHSLELQV